MKIYIALGVWDFDGEEILIVSADRQTCVEAADAHAAGWRQSPDGWWFGGHDELWVLEYELGGTKSTRQWIREKGPNPWQETERRPE